ncbi:MAG: DNA polymerase III subunit gamma/tau, partial [Prevotella sp.]|nr:DNA polymerase III subunit gamma/tau [Prevotella sp.]
CNNCESCQAFNEQRSYNIFELDAASNNSVENIKTLMEQTRIPPQIGKYKVFIIDEVHMLSTQAFNAFLKTLEEPPAHVIFILATTEKHKILPTIISRCQIYDFERMTVPNIISHLKEVAEKEHITYEEEALNIIAEKADGGMRDALSIFDQAVSFCQGDITYKKVIEDLNVLDSENYFNIIDLSLQNKVSEVMVLLNDILTKGFDGGHLISGLAKHVRNVMMAKDPQTLPLLETSQQQRERYKEQAQRCPNKFLYQALKVMNDCDINYRQSSNKRLLVELTLIEIAQITQEEDSASAGRRPRRLKSLFRKFIAQVQNKAVVQGAAGQRVSATDSYTINNGQPEKVSNTTEETVSSTASTETAVAKPQHRVKLKSIGHTFENMRQEEKPIYKQEEDIEVKKQEDFTEEQLIMQWTAMCNRMPQHMAGLSSRLRNILPTITNYPTVEVKVDNEILLKEISTIKNRIRSTLVQNLKNKDIVLNIRLAEGGELKKALTKKELFEEMLSTNHGLEKLQSELGLELI